MNRRIAAIALAAWAFRLAAADPAAAQAHPGGPSLHEGRSEYNKSAPRPPTCYDESLSSARARRIAASLIRLKLLELRQAQLERARAAVRGEITVDELLATPAPPRY